MMELRAFSRLSALHSLLAQDSFAAAFPQPPCPQEYLCICCEETAAGFVYHTDEWKYLYLFICPALRGRGLGRQAAALALETARAHGRKGVFTSYRADSPVSAAFAEAAGFPAQYASARMVYRGAPFAPQPLTVRAYRDADYDSAHALYAQAFHEMRLTIGCFPDSVIEPPSEQQRRVWRESADTRFVCELSGQVAGYAHVEGNELSSIAIRPSLQRNGLGGQFLRQLCTDILSQHETVVLYCLRGNIARRLYERTGFTEQWQEVYALWRRPDAT